MSDTQSKITVENLISTLQEMIKNKPITNKMVVCIGGDGKEIQEVKVSREKNGKAVLPYIILR